MIANEDNEEVVIMTVNAMVMQEDVSLGSWHQVSLTVYQMQKARSKTNFPQCFAFFFSWAR